MSKLSIVIPVYNEKDTILKILSKIEEVDLGDVEKEIIIVDDFSTDSTRDALDKLGDKYKVIYHDRNHGKGGALRTGFVHVTGDWVIIQDADLEYDPNDYKLLLEKMREPGVEVVFGSRRLNKNYFKARHSGHIFALGGIFLTWFTNFLYGTNISDESTCYKMFKTELLKKIDLRCKRFEFCPEFIAKVARRGMKIYEVPINYYPRHKEEGKKIGWRDAFEAVWTLIRYRF